MKKAGFILAAAVAGSVVLSAPVDGKKEIDRQRRLTQTEVRENRRKTYRDSRVKPDRNISKPATVTAPKPSTVAAPKPSTVAAPKPSTVAAPKPSTVAAPKPQPKEPDKSGKSDNKGREHKKEQIDPNAFRRDANGNMIPPKPVDEMGFWEYLIWELFFNW